VGGAASAHDRGMRRWLGVVVWSMAVAPFAVAGCSGSPSQTFKGSGHVVTERRSLAAFDRVELEGEGRLIIGPDARAGLEVRTDDNLLGLIHTDVVDGRLVIGIRPSSDLEPSDGLTYRVSCDRLSELRLSGSGAIEARDCPASHLIVRLDGSGTVRVEGVDATRVDAQIGGSGTIRAVGQSIQVNATVAGSGTVDGNELRARDVEAAIPGSGQVIVWATDTLDVDISGSGSVSYRGRPAVTQAISGSGAVTQGDDG
jgi:Putative auto-transporter adhesin, head GIN domain